MTPRIDGPATRAEMARLLRVEAAARALVDAAWRDGIRHMATPDLAALIAELYRALSPDPAASGEAP